jgi:hypothetical protein
MDFLKDLSTVAEVMLNHYGLCSSAPENTIDIMRRWVKIELKLTNAIF